MKPFTLRVSAFSICWLRAYDFGLEQDALESALPNLRKHSLVKDLARVGKPDEVDEIDLDLFDVRFLDSTKLVRVHLQPFELVTQKVGTERELTTPIRVNLLIDGGSGFGVFNLCMSQPNAQGDDAFSMEEITFLTRQWLLAKDGSGQPVHLKVCLPSEDQVTFLYLREVMNYYFIQIHRSLGQALGTEYDPQSVDQEWYVLMCHEEDPIGCKYLRDLHNSQRSHSLFPTSFGPILNIWGIDGLDRSNFDWHSFCREHAQEISWLFTDGRDRDLSDKVVQLDNEERRESRALFVWPNHAIHINQAADFILGESGTNRIDKYGLVDIEIVRIFELLNLQTALVHAFDGELEKMLEEISSGAANDPKAIIRIIEQRRRITRSIRTFDFFNLFHGAQLEPLYRRLLGNPGLKYRPATELVEAKARRLDDEIDQAVIIQDRIRQQQQNEQEIDILRGIHSLSLTNERQSNALAVINIVVSATAAFGLTEVLSPLLTSEFRAYPLFSQVYPWYWVGLNGLIFGIIMVILRVLFLRGTKSPPPSLMVEKKIQDLQKVMGSTVE